MKAFPWQERLNSDDPNVLNPVPHGGMDLRDYFAAKAMQGLMRYILDFEFNDGEETPDGIAKTAYEYADAMMKAREQ
jgi:hypothetical protein